MLIDHFDEPVAAYYDATEAAMFAPSAVEPAVDVLAGLAGDGRALELAIGTGRLALPLHARGVPVHGIDLSTAMVARLRAKPGAEGIGVTIGDIATTVVPGSFRVVYLVFNTITNLTTQDAQVACFENAARHLEPGGTFVIEVFVPGLQRVPWGESVRAHPVEPTRLDVDEYDIASQTLRSHHHRLRDGQWVGWSLPFRYVWPAELDLMARIAGMRLRERWADWHGAPFTSAERAARLHLGEARLTRSGALSPEATGPRREART